jgi:hypothetical protein
MDAEALRELGARARLFSPGERLGWVFRDRHRFWRPFGKPPPDPVTVDPRLEERARRLEAGRGLAADLEGANRRVAASVLLAFVALAASGVALYVASLTQPLDGVLVFGVAVALAAAPLTGAAARRRRVLGRLARARTFAEREHAAWLRRWREEEAEHQRRERERIDGLDEWGALQLSPGWRRFDVFGGTLWSWEAFLTVFGSSLLATSPPITVVDLSEGEVCAELANLALRAGLRVDAQSLPAQLEECDLLDGLEPRQLAEMLVESMYGDERGASRASRAMDARILGAVCEGLGERLTMGRLAEGLVALLGEPGSPRLLTREEWDRMASDLFSAGFVSHAHERLRRLEAFVHPLRDLGVRPRQRPPDVQLRLLSVTSPAPTARDDLLLDLVAQWAMREVARPERPPRALVVVGADRVPGRHLERLGDLCERSGVRHVLLFRHLRDDALRLLGGGPAVFMRLGNHQEAEQAANYIGRGHKFEISQLGVSRGGGETHTWSANDNLTVGVSGQRSETTSDARSVGSSKNVFEPPLGEGLAHLFLGRNAGSSEGESRTRTVGTAQGVSLSRTWGSTESYAASTNWHYAATKQRVYEYRVEPRTLQDLPDYALLVVESGPGGPRLRAGECDPDRVFLPRHSMQPLPEIEGAPAEGAVAVPGPRQAVPVESPRSLPPPEASV